MFYNKTGKVIPTARWGYPDHDPTVETMSRPKKNLVLRLSRCLVVHPRYDLLIGRGSALGTVALMWSPQGEYIVKMKPLRCEIRLAAFKGLRNENYQSPYQICKTVLLVKLPEAKWELEDWFNRLPKVSDNPSAARRRLAGMS